MTGRGRRGRATHRPWRPVWIGGLLAVVAVAAPVTPVSGPASAQAPEALTLTSAGGQERILGLARHRGYPAVPSAALEVAGWTLAAQEAGFFASLPGGLTLSIEPGIPFVRVDTTWAQLVHAPYELGDTLYVPLQLVTDLLPDRLPELYAAAGSRSLEIREADLWEAGLAGGEGPASDQDPAPVPADDGVRVVIIDAGHGGRDPGSLGRTRTREKDIALSVSQELARQLSNDPTLEVHLTRDSDVLVPLWERGQIASRIRGDRPGIFVSIHANAVARSDVRGFETYFLSEARTDHEARVAALENSVMELDRGPAQGPAQDELGAIIQDLLDRDFQHWSSDLAAEIQEEVVAIHPGPDRGVKQGPFAVLTNAMMPSVLVEVGFLSHAAEERVLRDPAFQEEISEAMARAIRSFFEGYPPGRGASSRTP